MSSNASVASIVVAFDRRVVEQHDLARFGGGVGELREHARRAPAPRNGLYMNTTRSPRGNAYAGRVGAHDLHVARDALRIARRGEVLARDLDQRRRDLDADHRAKRPPRGEQDDAPHPRAQVDERRALRRRAASASSSASACATGVGS